MFSLLIVIIIVLDSWVLFKFHIRVVYFDGFLIKVGSFPVLCFFFFVRNTCVSHSDFSQKEISVGLG